MSEFDKEAEREKLRKQFERDKRKREDTERMSELLLQGATMTDTHCDACGDPLFRYGGEEFCPSCQSPSDERQPTADTEQPEEPTATTESPESPGSAETTRIEIEDGTTFSDDATDSTPTAEPPAGPESPPTTARSDPDLSAARQSLAATITRFAKHAEATEDPDRARAFLAATEDAATALDALERATR